MIMRLRLATLADSALLLSWRNDPQTRWARLNQHKIIRDEHVHWLRYSLNYRNRRLYMAEVGGQALGTIRTDFDGQCYHLSWTIAPDFRGRGLGKKMAGILTDYIQKPIGAKIRRLNAASIRIAEYTGMSLEHEDEGWFIFSRK
jgi:RimJ/RimL family protein N-acetyltransferase